MSGLFRQIQRTGDGEGGFGFGRSVLGLGAAQAQSVFAGQDGAFALVAYARQRAGIDGEGDLAASTRGEANPLKAHQRVNGPIGLRGFEVGFDNFIAGNSAVVGDGDGRGKGVAGLERVGGELHRAVLEVGVAESIAEAPERFAGEIAIGAALEPRSR